MFKIKLSYFYNDELHTIDKSNNLVKITNELIEEDGCKRFKYVIDCKEKIVLDSFTLSRELKFEKGDKIFCNGYQSWTDSVEHSLEGKMRGLIHTPKFAIKKYSLNKYGDYHFIKYKNKKGLLHSFTYAYIRKNGGFHFLGSLNETFAYTVLFVDTINKNIEISSDIQGLEVTGTVKLLDFIVCNSSLLENAFTIYKRMLGLDKVYDKKMLGFTTWYNYYEDINENIVLDAIDYSSENKFDLVQIDDGYTIVGDWLEYIPEKFPNGLKDIVNKIHQKGMKAGLWMAPFVASVNSKLFSTHPEYFAKDENGKMIKAGCGWGGFYALDLEKEEVLKYIASSINHAVNTLGFDFLKLDFLYAASLLHSKSKSRAKLLYDAMILIKENAKNASILGCGVPLGPVFGLIDYCRIGCDVSLIYDDKWFMKAVHRERISTKNAILNTIFRRGLNGLGFINDPDVFVLRTDNCSLTDEQKEILVKVNFLCGGLVLTSDNPNKYTEKQKSLFQEAKLLADATVTDVNIEKDIVTINYVLDTCDYMLVFDVKKGKVLTR